MTKPQRRKNNVIPCVARRVYCSVFRRTQWTACPFRNARISSFRVRRSFRVLLPFSYCPFCFRLGPGTHSARGSWVFCSARPEFQYRSGLRSVRLFVSFNQRRVKYPFPRFRKIRKTKMPGDGVCPLENGLKAG